MSAETHTIPLAAKAVIGAVLVTGWGLFVGWSLEDVRRGRTAEAFMTLAKAAVFAWLLLSVVLA